MNNATKLAGFAAGLALTFGAAAGIGQAAGPSLEIEDPVNHSGTDHASGSHATGADDSRNEPGSESSTGASGEEHGSHGESEAAADSSATAASIPGGLMVSQDGYTLNLGQTQLPAGRGVPLTLTITDADGEPVTDFEVEHEKELHLIVVRRDGAGFQHVHPMMDARGTWRTQLDLTPGPWRVFADMAPSGGAPLTLGADLNVPGTYQPVTPPIERRTAQTVDGYTVTLDGDLAVGETSELTLTVRRDGRPVTNLDPYLGAYGHLVALRQGDLAYLHVHPDGTPGDGATDPGPQIVFYAQAPSAGGYQLYLDFKHNGVVRTSPLNLAATGPTGSTNSPNTAPEDPSEGTTGSTGGGASDADQSDGGHSDDGHSH